MNKTCDVCGRDYQKIVINPITKYCAGCDHVYKIEPLDVEPIIDLIQKALNKGANDKEAFGRYQAFRACVEALGKGNLAKLEKLAGTK